MLMSGSGTIVKKAVQGSIIQTYSLHFNYLVCQSSATWDFVENCLRGQARRRMLNNDQRGILKK